MKNAEDRFEGIYAYGQAARLLGVPVPRLKRWANGYTFLSSRGPRTSAPVLQTDRTTGVITFDELQELFFVKEYCAVGVALPHIREVAAALAKEVGPYPFVTQDLLVHGGKLLIETADGILQRPDVGQIVADFAREHCLRIQFEGRTAKRYTPDGYSQKIFLDRELRSGEPLVGEYAIPTRLIFALWQAEKNIQSVRDYFEVAEDEVMAAIRFEGDLRLAA